MSNARPDDLVCSELVELVTELLEGGLSPEERTRVEHHLVWCVGCSEYVRQIRTTARLARELRPVPCPPEVKQSLLAAFRGLKRSGT